MLNKFPRISPPQLPLYGRIILAIASLGIIGLIAFLTINYYLKHNVVRDPSLSTTGQQSVAAQLDALKKSATTKLEAGNQKGGVEDLQAALAIAKQSNNKAETLYFEQQIDFAKNSSFSPASNPAPTALPSGKNQPGFVTQ